MAKRRRFNLKVMRNNNKVLLRLRGDLNGSSACQMENTLQRLQDVAKASTLTVDFSGIRNLDYFGVVQSAKAIRSQRYRFLEISLSGLDATEENLFKRFGLENGKVTHAQH